MKFRLLAGLALLCAVAGTVYAATKASISPNVPGLGYVVFSIDADSGDHVQPDPATASLHGRTAYVFKGEVNSQAVLVYVRVTKASNGLFVDVAMDESESTLKTRVEALSLATVTSSAHPAPTDDAVDTAILTAMSANGN